MPARRTQVAGLLGVTVTAITELRQPPFRRSRVFLDLRRRALPTEVERRSEQGQLPVASRFATALGNALPPVVLPEVTRKFGCFPMSEKRSHIGFYHQAPRSVL
jgi:hypothetical protein